MYEKHLKSSLVITSHEIWMKIDILEVCIMEQFLNYGSLHNYLAEMQIWQLKLRFENVKIERTDYSLKFLQENHVNLFVYLEILR